MLGCIDVFVVIKSSSFVAYRSFNPSFTKVAYVFNVELSPQYMIADTTTLFSPFLNCTAKSVISTEVVGCCVGSQRLVPT